MAFRNYTLCVKVGLSINASFTRLVGTSCSMHAAPGSLGGNIGSKLRGKQSGPVLKKVVLPVETDTHKLVKFVCGSDYKKENPSDIEIKKDSEYPDWLWNVRIERPKPLYLEEPNTKNYWRRMKFQVYLQQKRIKSTRRF